MITFDDTELTAGELQRVEWGEALPKDYFYIPVIVHSEGSPHHEELWYSLRFNDAPPPASLTAYASKVPAGQTLWQAVRADLRVDFKYSDDNNFVIEGAKVYDTATNKHGKTLTRVLVWLMISEKIDTNMVHPLGMNVHWHDEGECNGNPVEQYFMTLPPEPVVPQSITPHVPGSSIEERLQAGRGTLDSRLIADLRQGQQKDIATLWQAFTAWLSKALPEQYDKLNPPATYKDFQDFALETGYELPENLKQLYRINNGGSMEHTANSILSLEFLPMHEVTSQWREWRALEQGMYLDGKYPTYPSGSIINTYANAKWIPLLSDGGGNHIGVDLDPGETGTKGQVINFGRDEDFKFVITHSFEDFLKLLLLQIADDHIVLEFDVDGSWCINNVQSHLTDELRRIIIPADFELPEKGTLAEIEELDMLYYDIFEGDKIAGSVSVKLERLRGEIAVQAGEPELTKAFQKIAASISPELDAQTASQQIMQQAPKQVGDMRLRSKISSLSDPDAFTLRLQAWDHTGGWQAKYGTQSIFVPPSNGSFALEVYSLHPAFDVNVFRQTEYFESAVAYTKEHQREIASAILAAIRQDYDNARANMDDEYRKAHAPPISSDEELLTLISPHTIFIHVSEDDDDKPQYIGYQFNCSWDEEHGVGVMTRGTNVIAHGQADAAL